jgi:hypothetical protein
MNREEQQVRAVLLSQAEGELLKRIQSGEPTSLPLEQGWQRAQAQVQPLAALKGDANISCCP